MTYAEQIRVFNEAVDKYGNKDRRRPRTLPTAASLKERIEPPVAKCKTSDEATILMFSGGIILYEKDGYSTVFPIREYLKVINGKDRFLYREKNGRWRWDYIFSDIGDARLAHNKRRREPQVSIDVIMGYDSNEENGYATKKDRWVLEDPRAEFAQRMVDAMFLADVIQTLSEEEKRTLYLRFWENLSYEKLGETLGKSNAAAWNDVHRILEVFRNYVED